MNLTTAAKDDKPETDLEETVMDCSSSTSEKKKSSCYRPMCIVRSLSLEESKCQWDKIKREMISSLNKNASLIIYFHAFYSPLNYFPSKQCVCTLVNIGAYVITMRDTHIVDGKKKVSVLYIPSRHELHISLYYYMQKMPISEGYQVAAFNNRDQEDTNSFLNDMISELVGNKLRNVCLILLGEFNYLYKELIYFVERLKKRDQTRQVPVIGGTMNELMICDLATCRFKVGGVIIAIKGYYMQSWTLSFNALCKTEEEIRMKYFEFKNRVELKKYSLGYMFYGVKRTQSLISFEEKMFRETFPKIDLFKIHGISGFASDDLGGEMYPIPDKFYDKKYSSTSSQIMLITYN